jgi:carboxyl-terminal processing protease
MALHLPTLHSMRRFVLQVLAASLALATFAAREAAARPGNPGVRDQQIALMVAALMDRKHLSQMRINDEVAKRALEMYLKSLDPMKMYFLQSDVDGFAPLEKQIDDAVRQGDVRIAKSIFDVFLARVLERTEVAQQLVDAPHDFTLDESMDRDPKKIPWATSVDEVNDRWRKRVKYDLLLLSTDDMKMEEAREKLHKRYKSISRRWEQTNNDELLELFLGAITSSFDPHSSYMSPQSLENFEIQMQLSLDGIGASLESKYGETVVRNLVPGGAAEKDGRLKVDDVIIGVGQGAGGEIEDITDMPLNDVVDKIRGKPNTVVRLEVKTAGGAGRQVYEITRAHIELKDSEARSKIIERGAHGEIIDVETNDPDQLTEATPAGDKPAASDATGRIVEQTDSSGRVIKIGIIDLPSFYMDMEARRAGREDYKSTTRDMRRLLEDFNAHKVDVAVVDLRWNGGGSLPESVETTGLFIDQGPVVQVKGPTGAVQPYPDEKPGAVWNGPLIVLINKFSASASEIFAGAIQDYGRGVVVGDRSTHGKGTVQELKDLGEALMPLNPPNMGALKLTIQQFYRPGGDSTQNRGVVSDVELPSQTSVWEVGESDLDYALKFDRVLPLPHENYRFAGAQVIQELRNRSAERCKKSEYFQAEERRTKRWIERKDEPLTLNEEKFLAERKEFDADKEQEKMFDDLQSNDRPVFPRTPYNDEVVAIALDYLELLGDGRLAAVK